MMDMVKSWILQITGAAMLTAAALSLAPAGRVKKVVALVCGLVVIAALISPIRTFDTKSFSKYMAELRSRPENVTSALTK
jgi:cytochrome c oxidase assembly factor CtaG